MRRLVCVSIRTSISTGTHPENAWDDTDPRWQLDLVGAPLAATDWYAEQSLSRRIEMGRWVTANTLKVTLQFEVMLIRGVVHNAGKLQNKSPLPCSGLFDGGSGCRERGHRQDTANQRQATDVGRRLPA